MRSHLTKDLSPIFRVMPFGVETKAPKAYIMASQINEWMIKMSQAPNRMFDEFAKLMTDAAGAAQGVKREAETAFRAQAERFLADMDLVKREDFDVVQEMAAKARAENEDLKKQLESMDKRIKALETAAKPAKRAARSK